MTAVEYVAHKAYNDHDLRICAHFAVLDNSMHVINGQNNESTIALAASPDHLTASARKPTLYWIPPAHEQHDGHTKPSVRFH